MKTIIDGPARILKKIYGANPPDELSDLLKQNLPSTLTTISFREQVVLELRFGLRNQEAHTLKEVSKFFNVTHSRIRQIQAKALRKMRHPTRLRRLGWSGM